MTYPGQAPGYATDAPSQDAPVYGAPTYGQPHGVYPPYPYARNDLGVWSLVLGIVSIVMGFGLLTGIPAVILGNKSRNAVAAGQADNAGLATAGIITGWIGIGLSVVGVIAFVLYFVLIVGILTAAGTSASAMVA